MTFSAFGSKGFTSAPAKRTRVHSALDFFSAASSRFLALLLKQIDVGSFARRPCSWTGPARGGPLSNSEVATALSPDLIWLPLPRELRVPLFRRRLGPVSNLWSSASAGNTSTSDKASPSSAPGDGLLLHGRGVDGSLAVHLATISSPAEESSVSKGGSSSTNPLDKSAGKESALRASALGVGPPSGGAGSGGQ